MVDDYRSVRCKGSIHHPIDSQAIKSGWLVPWSSRHVNLDGGWTNPSQKYARQNGIIFPKVRDENSKNIWNHQPENMDFPKSADSLQFSATWGGKLDIIFCQWNHHLASNKNENHGVMQRNHLRLQAEDIWENPDKAVQMEGHGPL